MARQEWIDPEDLRLLLLNVRFMNRWSQEQLAAAAGVDLATISRYENGRVPRRQDAERIFAAAGRPLAWLEAVLLPGLRAARLHPEGKPAPPATAATAPGFAAGLAQWIEGAQSQLAAGLPAAEGPGGPPRAGGARQAAEGLWAILTSCSDAERKVLVERLPAYQDWAAVERLCWESEREAANDPGQALALADLARRAAERSKPEGPGRARICAYARAYLGNALRVQNDHEGARQAFARAWELWLQGAAANLPLEEWRLLELAARC